MSARVPLLGIALVVDDANKGQCLVFRYPAPREAAHPSGNVDVNSGSSSYSRRAATGRDSRSSSSLLRAPSLPPSTGPRKDSGGSPDSWATQQCDAEFHQLSPEVLARLFRPKAQLCGRVMIDRVRYLSHPVLTASATKETAEDDVLLFNVILATARVHVRDPAAAECRRRQRQLRWIRAASGVSSSEQEEDRGDDEEHAEGVICALRPMQEALDRLTKALLHEERRCRYVSREVGLLLQIRESIQGNGWASAGDTQTMLDLMMEHSALANDLRSVFHGLKDMESGPGHDLTRPQLLEVAVNGWIRFSLPAHYPSCAGSEGDGGRLPTEIVAQFHTLLLLLDESELLAKLPADGSEQLRALVQACNPLKTLEELGAATCIAAAQLCLLSSHLVHWGYARVIPTITLRSVYAIKPSAPTHLGALPALAFQQRFPPHNFFRVLAAFGSGKTLQALLDGLPEETQVERLAMVVWLLQQDIIQ